MAPTKNCNYHPVIRNNVVHNPHPCLVNRYVYSYDIKLYIQHSRDDGNHVHPIITQEQDMWLFPSYIQYVDIGIYVYNLAKYKKMRNKTIFEQQSYMGLIVRC